MRPTTAYELFGGAVEVLIYGKQVIQPEEHHARQIALAMDITTVLRPDTHTFNAEICEPWDLRRRAKTDGVTIWDDYAADGVNLGRGQIVWFRTADCPTIVARNLRTRQVIAAHAGRDSLIDKSRFQNGQRETREHDSVVETICGCLLQTHDDPAMIEVFSCCGVSPIYFPHPINHPDHGRLNSQRNRYIAKMYGADCFLKGDTEIGCLDLHGLIRSQFVRQHVPNDGIGRDNIDTASDHTRFFSRRGGDKTGHNTILVVRRG